MSTLRLLWQSVKARVTLLTLLIFLGSIGSLTWYASRMLQDDLYRMLAAHQTEAVGLLAEQLGQELADRRRALEQVAARLPAQGVNSAMLREDLLLQDHFNGGIFVIDRNGVATADSDTQGRRMGRSYADRAYFQQALRTDASVIGQVVMGRVVRAPIIPMITPIPNAQGQTVSLLAGTIDLGHTNFVDSILHRHFSKGGEYLVIDRLARVVVTSSRKDHSLPALPPSGVDPQFDRMASGEEGSDLRTDAQGFQTLATVRHIPDTPWSVVGLLPAAEVFAPVRALRQRMVVAALLLALAASGLTWWMLRTQLSPLVDTARRLSALPVTDATPVALPIARADEVGDLIAAFNRLLQRRAVDEAALRESEERFRLGFENANIGMCLVDLEGHITRVNRQMCNIFGYSKAELEAMDVNAIAHPDYLQVSTAFIREAESGGEDHSEFEKVYLHRQGHAVRCLVSSSMVRNVQGEPLGFISHVMDITARKHAEERLELAASAFTHAQEGIMITDSHGDIVEVNDTFTRITGYDRDEVMGRNPRMLSSGRQDAAFYTQMWQTLAAQGHWSGEIWNRRKDGQMFAEYLTISAVRNAQGAVTRYVALFSDITERKVMEEQVRQFAFYDALTSLPNRRLLRDRLQQAMAHSERNGHYGAVMFLDLDNFKSLNDRHGHVAGDLLLVEVAERIKRCVRGVDTVARMGGDEFVVLVSELSQTQQDSREEARTVAEKVRLALAEPYRLTLSRAGEPDTLVEHHCTASMGVALFHRHSVTQDDVLQRADAAMYQAKSQGRNRVQVAEAA